MAINNDKPDVNEVWAESAATPDIADPDILIPGKTSLGWLGTDIPPHETYNFEQNRQSQFNKHVNIQGLPIWDTNTPYILGSLAKDPTDLNSYRSQEGTVATPNQGNQPSLNLDKWNIQEGDVETIITPTAVSPIDMVEVVDTTPTLTSSAFRTILNVAHSGSEYRVARDEAMTDLINLSGLLGAVITYDVSVALATGEDYFWDVRYQNADGTFSQRSIPASFSIPDSAVQTPTNLLPVDADTTVTDSQTFTADAFASTPPSTHTASQWQITTDINFITIDFDSGVDAVNLLSFPLTGLVLNETTYYWRVRYQSDNLGFSSFSPVFTFTTVNQAVQKPNNVTPTNGTTDVGATVQLTGDSFTSIPGGSQTHTQTDWQVATDADFTAIVFQSLADSVNLETITATGLTEGTVTHFWRVRYYGDITGASEYSTPFTFITKAQFSNFLNTYDGTNDGSEVDLSGQEPTMSPLAMSDTKVIIGRNVGTTLVTKVCVRSGTSITTGANQTIFTESNDVLTAAIEGTTSPDKFVSVHMDSAIPKLFFIAANSVSGSSTTAGSTTTVFSGNDLMSFSDVTHIGGDNFVVAIGDNSVTAQLRVADVDITDSTAVLGTQVSLTAFTGHSVLDTVGSIALCPISATGALLAVGGRRSSDSVFLVQLYDLTITGTTITGSKVLDIVESSSSVSAIPEQLVIRQMSDGTFFVHHIEEISANKFRNFSVISAAFSLVERFTSPSVSTASVLTDFPDSIPDLAGWVDSDEKEFTNMLFGPSNDADNTNSLTLNASSNGSMAFASMTVDKIFAVYENPSVGNFKAKILNGA